MRENILGLRHVKIGANSYRMHNNKTAFIRENLADGTSWPKNIKMAQTQLPHICCWYNNISASRLVCLWLGENKSWLLTVTQGQQDKCCHLQKVNSNLLWSCLHKRKSYERIHTGDLYGPGQEIALITPTHVLLVRTILWPHLTGREARKPRTAIVQAEVIHLWHKHRASPLRQRFCLSFFHVVPPASRTGISKLCPVKPQIVNI